ncbi:MAG: tetratricopeptide repeat protein [Planctomycetota bacterium]
MVIRQREKSATIIRDSDSSPIVRRTTEGGTVVSTKRRRPAQDTTVVKVDGRRRISNRKVVIDSSRTVNINKRGSRKRYYGRPKASTVIYRDNHRHVTLSDRHTRNRNFDGHHIRNRHFDGHRNVVYVHDNHHVYWDHYDRLCHRIIYPRYRYLVRYNWGPRFSFRYVYPYYHRKYVFVSLGGYWPLHHRYARYYWYGYHPYSWYGYYPIARQVKSDTYNYYTYNYYNDDTTPSGTYNQYVDENTFADVRERMAQQAAEEAPKETTADVLFDNAVEAFEVNDFDAASVLFFKAIELSPEDVVLRFAYSQALFANEQYTDAAVVLREALEMGSAEQQDGVFYPRGLYSSDEVLFEQINSLIKKVDAYPYDGDLQLLLGYHFLGIGEYEVAAEPLEQARLDIVNSKSATTLIKLLEKIQTTTLED